MVPFPGDRHGVLEQLVALSESPELAVRVRLATKGEGLKRSRRRLVLEDGPGATEEVGGVLVTRGAAGAELEHPLVEETEGPNRKKILFRRRKLGIPFVGCLVRCTRLLDLALLLVEHGKVVEIGRIGGLNVLRQVFKFADG